MIKAVIIGFAHMHVNEVALYIDGQPDTTLAGIADVAPRMPENTDKRYTRAWNLANVAELSGAPVYEGYSVVLDEVKICPESGWEVNVSAADHNKHTNRPEIVYVIDFTSKEPKEQFRAVFEVNSDVTQRY